MIDSRSTFWSLAFAVAAPLCCFAEPPTREVLSTQAFRDLRYDDDQSSDASASSKAGQGRVADLILPILDGDRQTQVETLETSNAPPIRVDGSPRGVAILIHGGGWASGDKFMMGAYADSIAHQGWCVLNINYRHAPEHRFPAQADDVRLAMLYVKRHADALSIDLNKVALFGYSAGAHLSLLIGMLSDETIAIQAAASDWAIDDPRWQALPKVAAVCAGGPPCDFTQLPPDNLTMSYFLGGSRRELPELYNAASPLVHASSGDPVTKLIHGQTDLIVPVTNSEQMASALLAVNVPVTLTIIPNSGHLLTFVHSAMKQSVQDFFDSVR